MAKKKQSAFDLIQSGKYNGKEYTTYQNDFDAIQNNHYRYIQKQEEQKQEQQEEKKDPLLKRIGKSLTSGWLNENNGTLNDGYQFGDFTKGLVATSTDLKQNYQKGVLSPFEAGIDAVTNISSGYVEKLGLQDTANKMREWAQKDFLYENMNKGVGKYLNKGAMNGLLNYSNIASAIDYAISYKDSKALNPFDEDTKANIDKYTQQNSAAGSKIKGGAQGIGQLGSQTALRLFGVPWQLTAFTSGMGNEMNKAFSEGATYNEAMISGLLSGLVELGTEKIGGLGETLLNTKTLTGALTKKLGKDIGKSTFSYITKWGLNGVSEGVEEVLSGLGNALAKKLTYGKDKDFDYNLEQGLDDFITSSMVALVAGSPTTYNQKINNIDPWTEKTVSQEKSDKAIELIEKQDGTLNDVNKNIVDNITKMYEEIDKIDKVSPEEIAEQYDILKKGQVDRFKKSSIEMFPNLDQNSRVLYNNLINDLSNVIYDTGVSMAFDPTLDSVFEWGEDGVLRLNPTKTNMPIKTVVLQELSNKLLDNKTKSNIISTLKKNGVYDTLKQELIATGEFDEANVDTEIVARALNEILTNEEQLKQFSESNKKTAKGIKEIFNEFMGKMSNRNTYDSAFIKQVNDNFGRLNLNDNINQNEFKVQENKIQGLEDYSKQEIKNIATDYIETALTYADVDAKIKGMEIIGSRNRGDAKSSSDLDLVVELDGEDLREDDLFNILNDTDEPLEINGIKVDINPIVEYRSGNLEEFMKRSNEYDKTKLAQNNNKQISKDNKLFEYSESKKNEVLSRGGVIATTKQELSKYVNEAFENKDSKKNIHIGSLSQENIDNIKENIKGIKKSDIDTLFKDGKEYDVAINQDAIRHMKKDGLTNQDVTNMILKLDDIIIDFDEVLRTKYEKKNQSNDGILFRKQFSDGKYAAYEIIYNKRKVLDTHTIYMDKVDFESKKKSTKSLPMNNNSQGYTSETQDSSISYDLNISQNDNNVNQGETRKTYESIIKSENQTPEAKEIARDLMGTDTYIPDSNQKQIERADEKIKTYGVDKSLEALKQNVETRGKLDVDDIAVGERLIDYYAKTGDKQNLQEAIQLTAMAGTIAGRSVQAMAMINRQSPTGQVTWIQRSVDRMNKQLQEQYDKSKLPFKKLQQFEFTPEMQQKILDSTDANLEQNLNEVYKELGQQVQMSALEKIDSWRYFAMLSSPTTHIRNIVGNLLMGKMQQAKNIIKGGIEDVYYGITGKQGERTKTLKFTPKKYVEFAKNDINNVKAQLGFGDNKYTNPKTQLQQNMRMFSNTPVGKFLEKTVKNGLIDTTSKLLEVEDIWGLKSAYTKSMSQYLYANNIDLDNITDKQLAQARQFAVDQAKQATFHQDSALASALNTLENKSLAAKVIIGGVVPFKKTPFNVAKTALEYNPVGLMKTLTYDSYRLANGKITANQYIDNISKGLTGTGIALLGYALAQAGIIRTSSDDDESYEEDRGVQPYSIRVGGKTISLDWLSPTAVPLFVGAELYNQFANMNNDLTEEEKQKTFKDSVLNVLNASVSSLNPVSEMTMLSGIQSALKTYSGNYAKALEEIGTNTIKTYVNQFTPSILGKIAKSTDKYERSTTSTKKTTVEKAIDSVVKQTMSKIPGLRQLLPTKTDAWGNEVKQIENPLLRTAYNLTSPANIKDVRETELDKELQRVYDSTGNVSVLPKTYIEKFFKFDNKEYRLTDGEYAAYKQILGKDNYEKLNQLINSSEYKSLSDEDKATVISKIYSYDKNAVKEAYAKINNIKYDSTSYETPKKVESLGGSVVDYYLYNSKVKSGDDTYTKRKKLKNMSISNNSKSAIYESSVSKSSLDLYKVLKESNVNINDYLDYLSVEFKADTDESGNTISGSKKNKVFAYMNNKSNLTYEQKLLILAKEYALDNESKTYVAYRVLNSRLTANEKQELYKSLKGFKVDSNGYVRW